MVMSLSEKQSLREDVIEILGIVKACLTSFWFWLPVAFAGLIYFELFIAFFVHPLAAVIAPALLVAYALREEKERLRTRYNLHKPSGSSDSKSLQESADRVWNEYAPCNIHSWNKKEEAPQPADSQYDATRAVEEYRAWLEGKKKEKAGSS